MQGFKVFLSALHLFIILFLVSLGSLFLTLYFYPNTLLYFINYLLEHPRVFFKIGIMTLSLTIVLSLVFFKINKAQYLKFTFEKNKYYINSDIIKSYLTSFLTKNYPNQKGDIEVSVLPSNKLEIIARVDELDIPKENLMDIEKKIGKLLFDQFNYQDDFIFIVKNEK